MDRATARTDGKRASLSDLAAARGALGGQSADLASWLAERLGPAAAGIDLRMITLRRAGGGALGVLIHGVAPPRRSSPRVVPLIATWSAAVSAAAIHARTRSLGEALAESNRNLTQMQRKLAEVQSMVRLGELTAGAAHEMNSPLASSAPARNPFPLAWPRAPTRPRWTRSSSPRIA